MPCNSDHLAPNRREVELSRVQCLLGELNGVPWHAAWWDGMHPEVYNKSTDRRDADAMVAELCSRLRAADVSQFSLEMQIWWRDHQRADAERLERENHDRARAETKAAAIAKLTPEERASIGL